MIDSLIRVCQEVGRKVPLWTQGAGSNLSVKNDGDLWIKGSGKRLDRIRTTSDLARVNIQKTLNALQTFVHSEESYCDTLKSFTDSAFSRASMETGFHVLLPSKWVLHFHSLPAILLGDDFRKDPQYWKNWLNRKSDLSFGVLGPVLPGWELSQKVAEEFGTRAPSIILLRCHGLVLHGEDPGELLRQWQAIEAAYLNHHGLNELFNTDGFASSRWLGPAKFFFPDAAVFWDRTEPCLEVQKNDYQLSPNAWSLNQDAVEIWVATQILHRARPDLEELDKSICEAVGLLPTELVRRNTLNP